MVYLEKIAEDLSNLTVIEAAELSTMLEEKWGVSAAAPVYSAQTTGGISCGLPEDLDREGLAPAF